MARAPHETLWAVPGDGSIISVAATPNLSVIVASSIAGTAYCIGHDGVVAWQRPIGEESWAAAISTDGLVAAFGTATKNPSGGAVHIFSARGDRLWCQEVGAPVWGVALSANGDCLYVASWDNRVRVYRRSDTTWRLSAERSFGTAGIYGVATCASGARALVTVYDEALLLVDQGLKVLRRFSCPEAGYETRITADGRRGIVGLRGGRALSVDCTEDGWARSAQPVSEHAVGGAATTSDGALSALGSFDGTVYVLNRSGRVLWRYLTSGEVWSVYMSPDGRFLCIGSGDRCVRLLQVRTDCQAISELEALEARVAHCRPDTAASREVVDALCALYGRYGLVEYGAARLLSAAGEVGDATATGSARRLLQMDLEQHADHARSQFMLAGLERARGDAASAASLYVRAGRDESLRLQSMLNAGDCFQDAGLPSAAMSCFRRAREQYVNDDDLRVLYNLARSYEDRGEVEEASTHYSVLLSWNPDYRDVAARLAGLQDGAAALRGSAPSPAGSTPSLSLLGPDIPRKDEVDPALLGVLDARAKELHVSPGDRGRLLDALDHYLVSQDPVDARSRDSLRYDEALYTKYDEHLSAEDEIKKHLEAINLMTEARCAPAHGRVLDIGAATGRHPLALAGLGMHAYGIDIEARAVQYASRKAAGARWPAFLVGDGRQLPFQDGRFDLITCMMGTIAHMAAAEQLELCRQASRCLRPGGRLVISTWDVDCRHLTFLSLYSQKQKELVRRNSLRRDQFRPLFLSAGLQCQELVPFALLPDVFSYELAVRGLTAHTLRRLVEIDLAARTSFPAMHGQMFLAVAVKPPDHLFTTSK